MYFASIVLMVTAVILSRDVPEKCVMNYLLVPAMGNPGILCVAETKGTRQKKMWKIFKRIKKNTKGGPLEKKI